MRSIGSSPHLPTIQLCSTILSFLLSILHSGTLISGKLTPRVSIDTEVEYGRNVTLRCVLPRSLVFYVTNANTVITTIGGINSYGECYYTDSSLKDKYNITAIPIGGLLTIINLENSKYGTYNCSDAFNARNSEGIDVFPVKRGKHNRGYSCKSLPYVMLFAAIYALS
ncbi:hypothetical protein DPMN_029239 [Dreissena polymorpha]|uniref:Immunoglobulin subtype domain-containing protein n=1 Tax=Dreissena polymorpha TaxID=45954 RepID=A0A9D4LW38_DREPO|nr:hypothetical protein DPMN_029239 [Dreissena polymorpha]